MSMLIEPAVGLMNRLDYRAKFLLISIVALAPLLLLSALVVQEARQAGAVVERERQGLQALVHLRTALDAQLRLRATLLGQPGDAAAARAAFEQAMAAFEAVAPAVGDSQAAVRQAWQQAATAAGDGEAAFEALTLVQDKLLVLRQEVARGARLQGDSDPAVVAAALWHERLTGVVLPRLAELRDRGVLALDKQFLAARVRNALTVARGELDAVLDALPGMREELAGLDATGVAALEAHEAKLQAGAIALGEALTTRLISASELDLPARDYAVVAESALDAGRALADALAPLAMQVLDARLQAMRNKVLLALSLSLLTLLAVAYLFSAAYTSIRRSLQALSRCTDALAGGDLSVRGEALTRDEVGEVVGHFNQTLDQLSGLMANVGQTGDALAARSGELAQAATELASGADRQLEAAQATAAAVEEIGASIRQVAENAERTEEQVRRTEQISGEGEAMVRRMSEQMQRLAERVIDSVTIIRSLDGRAQQIGGIVQVIQGVAAQTNLLALNAAIEAARAGEAGRGFAVVADEVGKLAENTAASTQRIEEMVAAILTDTQRAVMAMQASHDEVVASVELAGEASTAIAQIRAGASVNRASIAEVSLATREQSQAAQSIGENVDRIAGQAGQVAELSGDAARSAQHLDELAGGLRQILQRFRYA